eukprot:7337964-Lingulodinium_polyedra.AAC.1
MEHINGNQTEGETRAPAQWAGGNAFPPLFRKELIFAISACSPSGSHREIGERGVSFVCPAKPSNGI